MRQIASSLIPGAGELSATVMFEYTDAAQRQIDLRHLVGIEQHLWLTIGDTPPVLADFAEEQMSTDKISSVQYVKWRLNDAQRQLLKRDGTVVRLAFDHPHYTAQAISARLLRPPGTSVNFCLICCKLRSDRPQPVPKFLAVWA